MDEQSFRRALSTEESRNRLIASTIERFIERQTIGNAYTHIPPQRRAFIKVPRMHFHPIFEWVLQYCGTAIWHLIEGQIKIPTGDAFLIPRGVAHREDFIAELGSSAIVNISVHHKGVSVHFHIRSTVSNDWIGPQHWQMPIQIANPGFIFGLLNEATHAHAQGKPSESAYIRGLLQAALAAILDALQAADETSRSYSPLTAHCLERIRQYLSDPALNVGFLAQFLKCNPDYLSHIFKKETGEKLMSFINMERLMLSRQLLGESNLSIGQIAHACGYTDPNYFARLFKQLTGQTPRTYRATFGIRAVVENPLQTRRSD